MTAEEIAEVEKLVNEKIQEALPVTTQVMDIEEAKKSGAMALFDEKYSEKVRVVSMGDFSKELCGGTHVANTSAIYCIQTGIRVRYRSRCTSYRGTDWRRRIQIL